VLRPAHSRKDYIEFYDRIGELGVESSIYDEDHVAQARFARISELIDQRVPMDSRTLDLGCYDGAYSRVLATRSEPAAVDISRSALMRGRAKHGGRYRTIDWVLGDVEQIPFASCSFDFVLLSETLEHVNSPESVLVECHRVLRTGGKLLVSTPSAFDTPVRSHWERLKNALFEPPEVFSEALVNPRLIEGGVLHDGYVHRTYSCKQLREIGAEVGLNSLYEETCAPRLPRKVQPWALEKFPTSYEVLCRVLRFIPVVRRMGRHSVVLFHKPPVGLEGAATGQQPNERDPAH